MRVVSRCYVTLRHVTFVTLRNVMLYYVASFRLSFFSFLSLACLLFCVFNFLFLFYFCQKNKNEYKICHSHAAKNFT